MLENKPFNVRILLTFVCYPWRIGSHRTKGAHTMTNTQETNQKKPSNDISYVSIVTQTASHQEVPLFDAQVRNESIKMLESIYQ